jgi:hypothetical protein
VIGGAIVLLGAFVAQSSVGKVAPPEIPDTDEPAALDLTRSAPR